MKLFQIYHYLKSHESGPIFFSYSGTSKSNRGDQALYFSGQMPFLSRSQILKVDQKVSRRIKIERSIFKGSLMQNESFRFPFAILVFQKKTIIDQVILK